jgi:cytochrome P450
MYMTVCVLFVLEQELLHVTLDLFGAGTETTATTISWLLLYFLHYPQVIHTATCKIRIRDLTPFMTRQSHERFTLMKLEAA